MGNGYEGESDFLMDWFDFWILKLVRRIWGLGGWGAFGRSRDLGGWGLFGRSRDGMGFFFVWVLGCWCRLLWLRHLI